jgi:hypothetical protein
MEVQISVEQEAELSRIADGTGTKGVVSIWRKLLGRLYRFEARNNRLAKLQSHLQHVS